MINDHFIHTATPQTRTQTSDSMGGFSDTWTNGTDFKCRLRTLRSFEVVVDESKKPRSTHRMYCGKDEAVDYEMRYIINSQTYEVAGFNLVSDGIGNHHYEVELRYAP